MPGAKAFLTLFIACMLASAQDARFLFTGDVLLSRQVRVEIEQTHQFPFAGVQKLLQSADWVLGNLEGAVGSGADCLPAELSQPCFAIPPSLIPMLQQAGFRAMGISNNHAHDLGPKGVLDTAAALQQGGLEAISFEQSPVFVTVAGHKVAVIAVSTVPGRDGAKEEISSVAMRQKLRLARNLAELVILSIHWGSELLEWPNQQQQDMAAWLVANGADVIMGHHPHVVQDAQCISGKPVFYSLGNHLFDQKYPATKQGLIADCRIHGGKLQCSGIGTETPAGSSFPALTGKKAVLDACPVNLAVKTVSDIQLRGGSTEAGHHIEGWNGTQRVWRSQVMSLLSVESGRFDGKELLFTLERHASPIDGEEGVRPYVYELGPRGLVAKWRGSALAWPLLDAQILPGGDGVICALHRKDSFVALQPGSKETRTAAYHWNGFGFSGVDDPAVAKACQSIWASPGAVP